MLWLVVTGVEMFAELFVSFCNNQQRVGKLSKLFRSDADILSFSLVAIDRVFEIRNDHSIQLTVGITKNLERSKASGRAIIFHNGIFIRQKVLLNRTVRSTGATDFIELLNRHVLTHITYLP